MQHVLRNDSQVVFGLHQFMSLSCRKKDILHEHKRQPLRSVPGEFAALCSGSPSGGASGWERTRPQGIAVCREFERNLGAWSCPETQFRHCRGMFCSGFRIAARFWRRLRRGSHGRVTLPHAFGNCERPCSSYELLADSSYCCKEALLVLSVVWCSTFCCEVTLKGVGNTISAPVRSSGPRGIPPGLLECGPQGARREVH